ncbi:Bacterial membrane protein YfhO [Lentilactobacillus parabuchneri]|nr:Bacterial membrane protein YfhO [Lentilactobacillus parabuchneri]
MVWLTQGFTLKQASHNLLTYGILLSFLIVLLAALAFRLKNFQIKWLLIGLVLLNIISNGQGWLSPNNSHNLNAEVLSGTPAKWVKDFYDQANRALKKDKGFYRTSLLRGYYPQRTAGNDIPMVLGTHDLDSYYSIQNGFLSP